MSSLAQRISLVKSSGARDRVARGAVGSAALNIIATALSFAITVALTHALGVTGFGAYSFALAWSITLSVPAMLGLSPLILRNVAKYRVDSDWARLRGLLRHSHAIVVASSALIVGAASLVGALTLLPRPELFYPFLIALALVPLVALTMIRQSAMQGLGHVLLGRVPQTLVAPAVFLALVLAGVGAFGHRFSASAAMACQVGSTALAFALGLWLLRRTRPRQLRAANAVYEHREWGISGAWLMSMSIAGALSAQLAVILLGAVGTSAEAGVYQAAARAALFVSFLFTASGFAVTPALARFQAEHDHDELQRLLTRSVRLLFVLCLPLAVAFIAFAPQLLSVFGGGFRGGATVLRILVIGEVVRVGTGFGGMALVMAGHERDVLWITLAGLVLNVPLSLALIPALGGPGAAIGSTIALCLVQVGTVVLLRRRQGLSSAVLPLRLRRAP